MNNAEAEADGSGASSGDRARVDRDPASREFDSFRSGWEEEIGEGFPLPTFSPATMRDFRVRSRVTKVGDVAITDLHGASAIRTEGPLSGVEDQVGCMSSSAAPGRWAPRRPAANRP